MNIGLIICGETPASEVMWATGKAEQLTGAGVVDGYSRLPRVLMDQEMLVLVLPGDRAATRRLSLPVRGDRALTEAATLAFEDVLADQVDAYHFAFGPLTENGSRLVSAVRKDEIDAFLSPLSALGVEPDVIALDHHLAHVDGMGAVLLLIGDRLIAQLPEGGVTGDAAFLQALMAQMKLPETRLLAVAQRGQSILGRPDMVLADDRAISAFFLNGAVQAAIPNFRRGPYAKRRNWTALIGAWKSVGILAAASLALWVGDALVDGAKHQRGTARLYQEASATFSAAFPGVPIRDLRRQAMQRQSASTGSSFLMLMTKLSGAMEGDAALTLTGVRYTAEGELIAEVSFADAAALEQLKARLDEFGVRTREGGNLRREDNGDYAGQLFLEAI